MTKDEIRKLIAGYATNTLTDAERKSLFEAALDDQELFDALQQEQPLKELLADPVSRAQVQQALRQERASWWSRWWTWGSIASAAAAAVLIIAVVNQGQKPLPTARVAQTSPPAAPQSDAKPAEPKRDLDSVREQVARIPRIAKSGAKRVADAISPGNAEQPRKDQKEEVAAATPPPPPVTQQQQAQPPAAETAQVPRAPAQVPQQSQSVMHDQTRAQAPAAAGAARTQSQNAVGSFRDTETRQREYALAASQYVPNTPLLRVSLLKRDASGAYLPVTAGDLRTGDAVRLNVAPIAPGYLSLSRLDSTGAVTRIFPATGAGIPVAANTLYTIPEDAALEVTNREQKLRVTLVPEAARTESLEDGRMARASPSKAKAAPAPKPPSSLDITIRPGR